MKKSIILSLALLALTYTSAAAVETADLQFTKDSGGKYIYCNNNEFIRRSDLADTSNENPRYIMNNENMTPDNYTLFASHVNHTEKRSDDGYTILEGGFDIELDVIFRAKENTTITITSLGFEVPRNRQYWYEGNFYTFEDQWGCFNAWASYLKIPINQVDSGVSYEPTPFETVTFTVKAGEDAWLSQYIPNYDVVPFYRPVNLITDFSIDSGLCDINVAALKSNGTIGDRSSFYKNPSFGYYERDRQHKGISPNKNSVSAELSYVIDDYTWSDTALPVHVYNHYKPYGNETTKWYTHLNPRSDPWSHEISTESDMVSFTYYDPNKKNLYGSTIPESQRDDVWHFDIEHNDLAEPLSGLKSTHIPNAPLGEYDTDKDLACSMGNFGVIYNYKINVTNNGGMIRYLNYVPNTGSNIVVILRDENGNLINPYGLSKGINNARIKTTMVSVELPPQQTTTINIQVILTTNNYGGIENTLTITDTPQPVEIYKSGRQEITKDYNYTGKEFYKWENTHLYISKDLENWEKIVLCDELRYAIYGNWNQYELKYTGNGYMLKATLYDGIPYYLVCDFFKTVYLLDENFNLADKYEFNYYPTAFTMAKNVYYIKSGTPIYSSDFSDWNMSSDTTMPCWNYGEYVAKAKNGKIYLSSDGINFTEQDYGDFKPTYIDSLGNLYYYANGRDFYYSHDGLSWNKVTAENEISSIYKTDTEIVINKSERFIIE